MLEALEAIITELKISAELLGARFDTCEQFLVQQANQLTELRYEVDKLKAEIEKLKAVQNGQ